MILLTCACFPFYKGQAQVNYVLNGSFEQHSSCPSNFDQIKLAKYWQPIDSVDNVPLCSSEYCHICADDTSHVSIPLSFHYYHYPRTGSGMVLTTAYFDNGYPEQYQRDYTQGKLYTHLTAGKSYCVTFYVTLARLSQYAIDKFGAYLDDGSIDAGKGSAGCAVPQTAYMPQVFSAAIINDTLNWVKIQGNITAAGTERFITLGNFFDIGNTDTITLQPTSTNNFTWYLLDDVSVIASDAVADAGPSGLMGLGDSMHIGTYEDGMPCTWYVLGNPTPIGYGGGIWVHPTVTTSYVVALDLCNGVHYDTVTKYVCPAGISALSFPGELISFYPNPATTELHIDRAANCEIIITDLTGREVLRTTLANDKAVVDIGSLSTGIYPVRLTDPLTGNSVVRKVVKE